MMKLLIVFSSLFLYFNAYAESITINGEDDWAPYALVSADRQSVIGFSADIIRAAFASQNVDVNFKPYPYPRCMENALTGKAIACFDTVLDENTNANFIHHPTPMFESRIVIWVPASSSENNLLLKNLEGKKVGVVSGFEYSIPFAHNKAIVKEGSSSELSILKKLALGRIQYGLTYELPGLYFVKKNQELHGKVKIAGLISTEKIYVSFSKVHKQGEHYSSVFERGLKAIKANGTYKKLETSFNKNLTE